jgi:hypothetical protein
MYGLGILTGFCVIVNFEEDFPQTKDSPFPKSRG